MSKTNSSYARTLKIQSRIYIIILIFLIVGEIFIAPLYFENVSKIKQSDMIEYATTAWNYGLNYINYSEVNLSSSLLVDLASLQNMPLKSITPMNFILTLKTDIFGEAIVKIQDNVFTFTDKNHVGRNFKVTFYADGQIGISHPFSIGTFLKYASLFILVDIIFIIAIMDIRREMKTTKIK
jgi:glutamine cyclotransferase